MEVTRIPTQTGTEAEAVGEAGSRTAELVHEVEGDRLEVGTATGIVSTWTNLSMLDHPLRTLPRPEVADEDGEVETQVDALRKDETVWIIVSDPMKEATIGVVGDFIGADEVEMIRRFRKRLTNTVPLEEEEEV